MDKSETLGGPDDSDPIEAIENLCKQHNLTVLERLKLADLIASRLSDPESPPLTIDDAVQTILDQRQEYPDDD